MQLLTFDAGAEDDEYTGRLYEEHYEGLQKYFRPQLRSAVMAEACIRKTINLLIFHMEGRCWEDERKNVPVYLMRIAGAVLCKVKSALREARSRGLAFLKAAAHLLKEFIGEVVRPFGESLGRARLSLGAWLVVAHTRAQPAHFGRAPAAHA
jgi:hypothetical protein